MVEEDLKKKVDVTRETIEELGEQIKEMLQGVKANIDDYRFTVTSRKDGMDVEFFIKASFNKTSTPVKAEKKK
jgi:hypothetical protein